MEFTQTQKQFYKRIVQQFMAWIMKFKFKKKKKIIISLIKGPIEIGGDPQTLITMI